MTRRRDVIRRFKLRWTGRGRQALVLPHWFGRDQHVRMQGDADDGVEMLEGLGQPCVTRSSRRAPPGA
jgi:hypothetical protein